MTKTKMKKIILKDGDVITSKQLKLPDKLSSLITVALKDLERVERSKKYKVYMENWHVPNSHCSVCLAGAVMSRVVSPKQRVGYLEIFDNLLWNKFNALNYIREGRVRSALEMLNVPLLYNYYDGCVSFNGQRIDARIDVTTYWVDRKQWHLDMKKIVKLLRRVGL